MAADSAEPELKWLQSQRKSTCCPRDRRRRKEDYTHAGTACLVSAFLILCESETDADVRPSEAADHKIYNVFVSVSTLVPECPSTNATTVSLSSFGPCAVRHISAS